MLIDFLLVGVYLYIVARVGFKFKNQNHTLKEFALGGQNMPFWAVLLSIIAAETSAGTFLGVPGEGFTQKNFVYLQVGIGMVLGRVVAGSLFLKLFFQHQVFSIYEYLEARFGPRTRRASTILFLFTRLLASGTRLYVAAIILVVLWNIWRMQTGGGLLTSGEQIGIYSVAIILMTIFTAAYTAMGGIRAVIWTDVLQSGLMMLSALAAVVVLLTKVGVSSLSNVDWTFFNFTMDWKTILTSPYTIWGGVLAASFTTMATHGTDQDMVQRALTAKNAKEGKWSLIGSGLLDLPIIGIFLLIGILLQQFYTAVPDVNLPKKTNEIFAYFIIKEMPVGVRALMLAGLLSTAMGSLSAALNALATTFTRDLERVRLGSFQKAKVSEGGMGAVRIARASTVGFAIAMCIVAVCTAFFVVYQPDSRIIPIALGIFGYTYGSLLGVFLLGALTKKRGSDYLNPWAMLAGFVVVFVMSGLPNDICMLLGKEPLSIFKNIPAIAFVWRIPLGALVTVLVGLCARKAAPH